LRTAENIDMPAPISMDLRLRIVRAVERGSSIRAAAWRFAVSPSAAIKLMQRVRATGSARPARYGGHRPPGHGGWRTPNERRHLAPRAQESERIGVPPPH
jgi:transposase